jgi:hypothetical protein
MFVNHLLVHRHNLRSKLVHALYRLKSWLVDIVRELLSFEILLPRVLLLSFETLTFVVLLISIVVFHVTKQTKKKVAHIACIG